MFEHRKEPLLARRQFIGRMTRAFLATLALVLYARLLFVSLTAIVIAPALHRMLHKLHLEETKDAER